MLEIPVKRTAGRPATPYLPGNQPHAERERHPRLRESHAHPRRDVKVGNGAAAAAQTTTGTRPDGEYMASAISRRRPLRFFLAGVLYKATATKEEGEGTTTVFEEDASGKLIFTCD
ncbi:hypothetical protein MRX96_046926 [Rhipicephalus microplus]